MSRWERIGSPAMLSNDLDDLGPQKTNERQGRSERQIEE